MEGERQWLGKVGEAIGRGGAISTTLRSEILRNSLLSREFVTVE